MASTIRQTVLFNRRDVLRSVPANGNKINPSVTGSAPPLNGLGSGLASAELGKLAVIVTLVAPAPAGIVVGENVAVAPVAIVWLDGFKVIAGGTV